MGGEGHMGREIGRLLTVRGREGDIVRREDRPLLSGVMVEWRRGTDVTGGMRAVFSGILGDGLNARLGAGGGAVLKSPFIKSFCNSYRKSSFT